ncbi:PREDICTED: WD repeat domain-containing protein 83 isoform X2 [Gekko japonicus]|uniref:WD repeat domain-containing protein 83 n=1 Tax=Gekko japonicus TaxID=146911 RepID=A0ABM1KCB3_GEKJA|nr:PREDICTED: WD repeat domain-containing protein 83 isoform X2 [Gekko japonicus]
MLVLFYFASSSVLIQWMGITVSLVAVTSHSSSGTPTKGLSSRHTVAMAMRSFDNSQLCSCGSDKTVVLWDVARGQVIRKFRAHAGKVNCVQFSEEAMILSGSIDSSIRCWDCRSRRPDSIQILDEAKDGISSLKVSDHEILTGSVDGRVRRYDLRAGELCSDYMGSECAELHLQIWCLVRRL